MVRFIIFWKNTPTDIEAFERHYREVHIPLAKKLVGLRRYTASRNNSPVRGGVGRSNVRARGVETISPALSWIRQASRTHGRFTGPSSG